MSEAETQATIRNAREADEPQMLELLHRVFQRWPAFEIDVPAIQHLRWKMRSDPIASRHHWVSEIDGEIAALLLSIACRVRVGGRDCLARESADAAVDPRYRGAKLYASMADHVDGTAQSAEFDLSFWYGTNPRTRRRRRLEERKVLANPIQVLEKPYRARAIVARRREKHGGRVPVPLSVLRIKAEAAFNRLGHWPYWRPARRAWSVSTLERFDERIEAFFDQAARPFDFLLVRGKDYMNWRFCDPAAGRFTVRAAVQEEGILGYLVLKVGNGNGYIVDLLALPGRSDVVRSLLEDALHLFRQADVELVTCWMVRRHPYNGILRRYGFIDSRKNAGFAFRSVRLAESEVELLTSERARIHLTHGDSDWV
jgi:hypothetical protein